jgi:hypothetical protein
MSMPARLNIAQVFVIHYKKLMDRKAFITDQLAQNQIGAVEWITNYDKDEWCLNQMKDWYPFMFDASGIHCKLIQSPLNLSDVSLSLKHQYVMSRIVDETIEDALVFEDDCVLQPEFTARFNDYKKQLPEDWHLLFVGGDKQKPDNIIPEKNVYRKSGFHSSRGTFCYAVSQAGAQLMLPLFLRINDPSDWYFNHVIDTLNVNNYWAEPPLVRHNDSFASTRYYDYSKLKKA